MGETSRPPSGIGNIQEMRPEQELACPERGLADTCSTPVIGPGANLAAIRPVTLNATLGGWSGKIFLHWVKIGPGSWEQQ